MKKIIPLVSSVVIMLVVVGLVAGAAGSFAYFSDTETSEGNTFQADRHDLDIGMEPSDLGDDNVVMFSVNNINPGEFGKEVIHIHKCETSEIVRKTIKCSQLVESENSCDEPESNVDDTPNSGELASRLYIEIGEDADGDGTTDTVFWEGYADEMDDTEYLHMGDGWQKPADTKRIVVRWGIDDSVGNVIQTDSCEIDLEFGLIDKEAKFDGDPQEGIQEPPWE